MFSEELEALIEVAILEGELPDKKRQILIKRAVSEGIDPDEFEMILDSRLYKRRKSLGREPGYTAPAAAAGMPVPPPVPAPAPSTANPKVGNVPKCPNCGAIVESGTISCVECGHTFVNMQGNSSVQRFAEMLREIEARHQTGNGGKVFNSIAKGLGASSRKNEICTAIDTFPIPNSKEDLLEFLCFLKPKSEKNKKGAFVKTVDGIMNVSTLGIYGVLSRTAGGDTRIDEAYKAKYQECLNKAKLYLRTDPLFENMLIQHGILPPKKKWLF